MKKHKIKCWPEFFGAIADGSKKFELRKDDRDYRVGDEITLCEWCPAEKQPTQRLLDLKITYILAGHAGLAPGYVILSIAKKKEKGVEGAKIIENAIKQGKGNHGMENTTPSQERWLKASQVARMLNLHKKTLSRYMHQGIIPAKKIGHHWRIPESGLRDYLNEK